VRLGDGDGGRRLFLTVLLPAPAGADVLVMLAAGETAFPRPCIAGLLARHRRSARLHGRRRSARRTNDRRWANFSSRRVRYIFRAPSAPARAATGRCPMPLPAAPVEQDRRRSPLRPPRRRTT